MSTDWDDAEITIGYRAPDLVVSEQLADELGRDAMPEVMEMIRDAYARLLQDETYRARTPLPPMLSGRLVRDPSAVPVRVVGPLGLPVAPPLKVQYVPTVQAGPEPAHTEQARAFPGRATIGLMILEPVSRIAAQHDYNPPSGMRFESSPDVLEPITGGFPAPEGQRTLFGIPVHQVYPLKPGAWQVVDPAGRVLANGVAAPDHMAVVERQQLPPMLPPAWAVMGAPELGIPRIIPLSMVRAIPPTPHIKVTDIH